MMSEQLHSNRLEKLVGTVRCDLIFQEDRFRMVHLRDTAGISRTLGIVRFSEVESEPLRKAHEKIRSGNLLGETLMDEAIAFEKIPLGTFEVGLPAWLQAEFATDLGSSLAFYSKIYIVPPDVLKEQALYAEIVEVLQPQLRDAFVSYESPVGSWDQSLRDLCETANLSLMKPSHTNQNRCIVVGAGPGGLVAVKELLEQGIEAVTCLEQSQEVGGIFAKGYDNLVLTSSVTFSMFSDFWVGEGMDHHFWTKEEAVAYWKAYAEHFGVTKHIRFGSQVTEVTETKDGGWQLSLASGESLACEHLILAIGNNNIPRYPEWSSKVTAIPVSHSRDYKNAAPFEGKRVLVVGGGESGSDVAYEIAQVASQCYVSLRESTGWIVPRRRGAHAADVSTHRGIWDLPREYGKILSPFVLKLERARKDPVFDALADLNEKVPAERGIWGIFGTKTLALPKAIAYYGCKVVGDILQVEAGGRRLTAASGETLEDLDAIVFCTGYQNRVDFMPQHLQSCDPRQMYKHMFHPEYGDRIAWIGWARPGFGSQFPIMEMQARYAALIFSKQMMLPDADTMRSIAREDFEQYRVQFEANAERIRSLVDYHRYMNGMARIMGCYPPITSYFLLRPRLWTHLMYGPTQATQFRLRGPGKKVKLAHEILRKLPISTFNHIVKAGLRGRVRYGFRAITPAFIKTKA